MSFTGQDICLRQALKRNSSEESYSNPKKDTDSDSDSSVEFNPKRIAASTKQVQSFHKLYSPNNKTKLASAEEQILYYKSLMKKHRSELYVIKAENVSCNICQQTLSSKGTNASNAISKHEITSKHSFYFQKWLKKQSEILQICQENDIRMEKLNKAYKKILFMLNVCFSNCGIEEMSPLNVLVSEFNQIEIMNIKESEMIISMIYEVCKDRVNRDLLNKEFVMTVKEFKDKGKSFVIIGAYFKNKAFANVHKVLHFESLINNRPATVRQINELFPALGSNSAVELGQKLLDIAVKTGSVKAIKMLHSLCFKVDILRYREFNTFIVTDIKETCVQRLEADTFDVVSAYLVDIFASTVIMEYVYLGKKNETALQEGIALLKNTPRFAKSPVHILCIHTMESVLGGNEMVTTDLGDLNKVGRNANYEEVFFRLFKRHLGTLIDASEGLETNLLLFIQYADRKFLLKEEVSELVKNSYLIHRIGDKFVPLLIGSLLKYFATKLSYQDDEPKAKKIKESFSIGEMIQELAVSENVSKTLKKFAKDESFMHGLRKTVGNCDGANTLLDVFEAIFGILSPYGDYSSLLASLLISTRVLDGKTCGRIIAFASKLVILSETSYTKGKLLLLLFADLASNDYQEKLSTKQAFAYGEGLGLLLITKNKVKEYVNSEKLLQHLKTYLEERDGHQQITNSDIVILNGFSKLFQTMVLKKHMDQSYSDWLLNLVKSFGLVLEQIASNVPGDFSNEYSECLELEKYACLFSVISRTKFQLMDIGVTDILGEDSIKKIFKMCSKILSGGFFHDLTSATFDISLIYTESFNYLLYAHTFLNKPFQPLRWKCLTEIVGYDEKLLNKAFDKSLVQDVDLLQLLENLKPFEFKDLNLLAVFKVVEYIAKKRQVSLVNVNSYIIKAVTHLEASNDNIFKALAMIGKLIANLGKKNEAQSAVETAVLLMSNVNYGKLTSETPMLSVNGLLIIVLILKDILKSDSPAISNQAANIGMIMARVIQTIVSLKAQTTERKILEKLLSVEYYMALCCQCLSFKKDMFRRLAPYIVSSSLDHTKELTLPVLNLLKICDKDGINLISAKLSSISRHRFSVVHKQFAKYKNIIG
uniref:Zf-C2H2_12 domain-containing protein n=1 Tax=Rhabditophanes sp. KR3021 TaxID=114890 RepID=A0AC35THI6_9BILA